MSATSEKEKKAEKPKSAELEVEEELEENNNKIAACAEDATSVSI